MKKKSTNVYYNKELFFLPCPKIISKFEIMMEKPKTKGNHVKME